MSLRNVTSWLSTVENGGIICKNPSLSAENEIMSKYWHNLIFYAKHPNFPKVPSLPLLTISLAPEFNS